MSLDLRPLSLGELLDRAFTLYRRHFRLFVGVMALPSIFTLMFALGSELLQAMARNQAESFPQRDPTTIIGLFIAGGIVFTVVFVAYLIAHMVALGATTVAVSEIYTGRDATIRGAYARIRGQVGRLVLLFLLIAVRVVALLVAAGIVMSVVTAGVAAAVSGGAGAILSTVGFVVGFFGFMLGIFIFVLRYSVSVPALVLENITARNAIRRSVHLTKGSLGRAAVLAIFATIIAYAALFLLQGPFTIGILMAGPGTNAALVFSLLGAVAGTIGGAVTGPLMIIALAVFYYDVRIRKEGLDLQLMVADLDHPPAAPAPAI
jgi:hypothetical protein